MLTCPSESRRNFGSIVAQLLAGEMSRGGNGSSSVVSRELMGWQSERRRDQGMAADETMGVFIEHGKRAAACCAIAGIGILSLLPADEVAPIRTSLGGHLEHVAAYVVTTLITTIGYVDHSRLKIALSLILYAAVL